ncbi:carbamoyl-phosphate synthase (glutamine-hydrolyzing) large subunit [Patescibacteria group bacterium]|nr:carbamoyl-phosphate synthase (glutamine-hydrolyzing) large subunit [Patescibacteria group bacterium]
MSIKTVRKTRKRPKNVLILGSGGLKIGQAGEFDYSGSQAIKALQEEGIRTVLINPNIATIQTSEDMADEVYFLPVTPEFVKKIIVKEKIDGILLSFGGQTGLNVGLELYQCGFLTKQSVSVLGTHPHVILDTEDRDRFKKRLSEINVRTPRSKAVTSKRAGLAAAREIGLPVLIRSAYSLGGQGSRICATQKELTEALEVALANSSQVIIDEFLKGWKEIEYEVVRDSYDNCITVCNMENFDPMGIHTGESIVVAPSQTLNNREYHFLREIAIKTIRHLNIVGECNIQYAFNPKNGEYRVIEVNARLSRSSALASKATGYPLAFIAAKLSLGYSLTELQNAITKVTTACFEPALDYIVVKVPRWDLKKFKSSDQRLGSEMKSVGEIMAIGRTFEEALQKALRMLNIGVEGLVLNELTISDPWEHIIHPTERRVFAIARVLEDGANIEEVYRKSLIDKWFLYKCKNIVDAERQLKKQGLKKAAVSRAKRLGYSDVQIARLLGVDHDKVRAYRKKNSIIPFIKQIDTLAAEYPAKTNYLYFTYNGTASDVVKQKKSIITLGSGPYRIGSSVEFDWCAVNAVKTSKEKGYNSIVVNCNPETVSTDYDVSDRLYFEELTLERVLDIIEFESDTKGVIVSFGGQIPNDLAMDLYKHNVPVLGTHPKDIDRAEDRHKFSKLLDTLGIDQPLWSELSTLESAKRFAKDVGYPVLVRPSYVLSGAAMNVAYDDTALTEVLEQAAIVSKEHPVVISKFIKNAREIEIDGVAKNGELKIYAISEHVENAGVHSGDATVVLPPQKTYLETVRRAKNTTREIINALNITGPFNIQFLAKNNDIKVIECNLRASRSFPFVSKATGYNFVEKAVLGMLGEDVGNNYNTLDLDYVVVKAPQFSFSKLKGADPVLYVEMASTGEVACFGNDLFEAFLKSILSTGFELPKKNILVSIGHESNKMNLLGAMTSLAKKGFNLIATEHTADFLKKYEIPCKKVYKISSTKKPNVSEYLTKDKLDLIINIPTKYNKKETTDGFKIRRKAADYNIPIISNRQVAKLLVKSIERKGMKDLAIKSWSEYLDEKR